MEDKIDSLSLEGNTLVNMGIRKNPITSHYSDLTFSGDMVKGVSTKGTDTGFYFEPTSEAIDMMRGKAVTAFLYYIQASGDTSFSVLNRTTNVYYAQSIPIGQDKKDIKFSFNVPNDIKNSDDLEIIIMHPEGIGTWTELRNKLMILDGDWTNKKSPQYFKGIKSSGEKSNDNSYSLNMSKHENKITSLNRGTVASVDGVPYDWDARVGTNLIPVKGNEINIEGLTDKEESLVFCYDADNVYLGKAKDDWNTDRVGIKLKPRTDSVYIVWKRTGHNDIIIHPDDYKTVSVYETSNKADFNIKLDEPLRKIPGGASDKIVKKNGEWLIERNTGELSGKDVNRVTLNYQNDDFIRVRVEDLNGLRVDDGKSPIISNKLPFGGTYSSQAQIQNYQNVEVVLTSPEDKKHMGICYVTLSKDVAPTLLDAKNWIDSNDLTIVYELDTPQYESIAFNLDENLYNIGTEICSYSTVPPHITTVIDRIFSMAIISTNEAISDKTSTSISYARNITNQMPESLLKDFLQEQLNNVPVVDDLALDAKSVSANVDIYIKSENMLSLSLDTNSVNFDDFSGVEDVEKQNAVNLMVSSSLPYKVNAYLATEIQNADKSKVMDESILNIRLC